MTKKCWLLACLLFALRSKAQLPEHAITLTKNAPAGYYFLTVDQTGPIAILDSAGNVVYYGFTPQLTDIVNFKLETNGRMGYTNLHQYYLMDSTFHVVDSLTTKNYNCDAHDLKLLPNGHVLLMGIERVTRDLSAFHWGGVYGARDSKFLSGLLQELDSAGNVVFEWHAKDHFAFDDVDTFRYSTSAFYDWTHFNSLDLDTDGNILVSMRNFDEITKIDHRDGSVMWRLGGKRNQFKFVNCPIPFYAQRNLRVLPNGHITLFDGGDNEVAHGARALEFALDEKNKTATLVWSYTYDSAISSQTWGNVQRLSNSYTLVDCGSPMEGTGGFVVVSEAGQKVFELKGFNIFRAFNYPSLPFKLNRPKITCIDSAGHKYLDAGSGYSYYDWGNGQSSRMIELTKAGKYSVFVPYGEDGYLCSDILTVTDIANPCGQKLKGKRLKYE